MGFFIMAVKLAIAAFLLSTTAAIGQTVEDMLDPKVLAAIGKVSIENQTIKEDGPLPSVIFQIKNNSDHAFRMLIIECGVMKTGKLVASAEGFIMNFLPGQTASTDAPYQMTKEALGADEAQCRPSMGM